MIPRIFFAPPPESMSPKQVTLLCRTLWVLVNMALRIVAYINGWVTLCTAIGRQQFCIGQVPWTGLCVFPTAPSYMEVGVMLKQSPLQ